MKKISVVLLLAVFLNGCGNPTSNCIRDTILVEGLTPRSDMKLADKEAFVSCGSSIKQVSLIDGSMSIFYSGLEFCTELAADSSKLYAWDDFKKSIEVITLDEGKLVDSIPFTTDTVIKMEVCDGRVVLLHQQSHEHKHKEALGHEKELTVISSAKEKHEITAELKKDIISFAKYTKKSILINCHSNNGCECIEYNLEDGSFEKISLNLEYFNEFCFTSDRRHVFYVNENKVTGYDLVQNSKRTAYVADRGSILKVCGISDNRCYVLNKSDGQIYCLPVVKDTDASKTLTIYSGNYTLTGTSKFVLCKDKYEARHPDTKVILHDMKRFPYYEKIKTMLMAGENDPDMFLLDCLESDHFIRKRVMLGLEETRIADRFDLMFPVIHTICSNKGYIFGVPLTCNVQGFAVNSNLHRELRIDLPEGFWNWDSYYELPRQVSRDIDGDGIKDTYISHCLHDNIMLSQYDSVHTDFVEGTANYNTDEFIRLLSLCKAIRDENLVLEGNGRSDNVLFAERVVSLGTYSDGDLKTEFVFQPTMDIGNPVFTTDPDYICINVNSDVTDEALEFLDTYLSQEVQMSSMLMPVLYSSISDYKLTLDDMPGFRAEYTFHDENTQKVFIGTLNNASRYSLNLSLRDYRLKILKDMYEERITPEVAAKLMDEKASMVLNE